MAFVLRTELPRHGISVCEYNGSLVQRPYGGVQVPTGDKVFRGPARARPRAFYGHDVHRAVLPPYCRTGC